MSKKSSKFAAEKMNLPAVKFTKSDQHTRVFLFPQKSLKEMTKPEKTAADTVEAGLIKPADTETASKKYMTYIPYYG